MKERAMTYEYVCVACHHEWESEQRISAKRLETCPSCGQKTAKRQVSGGAGFILKGGGWYADGYTAKKSSGGSDDKKPTEKAAKPSKESAPAAKESTAPASTSQPAPATQ
jgi:putative FmdB family regulatory protein